jgi:streptomycin 6-kinase
VNIIIPEKFREFRISQDGSFALVWLNTIPSLIENALINWNLELVSPTPKAGATGLVFFVKRGSKKFVLKVGWKDSNTVSESVALRLWGGNSAVSVENYDAKSHVMLMERLTDKTLASVPIFQAAEVAGKIIKALSLRPNITLPSLADRSREIQKSFITFANDATKEYGFIDFKSLLVMLDNRKAELEELLVHGDVHYENILLSEVGIWKAIDPKPLIGDIEFSIPELMWTRVDELRDDEIHKLLSTIVDAGALGYQKALEWSIIRSIDYYFWAVSSGLTDDPPRCRRVYDALMKHYTNNKV